VYVVYTVCLYLLSRSNYLFIHLIIPLRDAGLRVFLNARHWRHCREFASFKSCRTTLPLNDKQFKNLLTYLDHSRRDKKNNIFNLLNKW